MKEIVLATGNAAKIPEIASVLNGRIENVRSLKDFDIESAEETGNTYHWNAEIKSVDCCRKTGLPSLADDSGIEVACLNGAPGVYTARYAPKGEKIPKLLNEMKGHDDRSAKYVAVIAFSYRNDTKIQSGEIIKMVSTKFFHHEVHGTILEEPRGTNGFDFDPVFYIPELGRTVAELDAEEKNRISHRGGALRKFLEWLDLPDTKETLEKLHHL